jgi:MFS family permease
VAEENESAGRPRSRRVVVTALGTSQTLAWASSYYLPAILADPISAGIGIPRSWFFASFSGSLLIAAFAGPAVGRIIDRYGGRGVLVLSNLVFAGGLTALAATNGALGLVAAWMVLGVGMALGLYDAGFATLAALYGHKARGPITGITLFAGFASTVSWPLSTFLNTAVPARVLYQISLRALGVCVGHGARRPGGVAGGAGIAAHGGELDIMMPDLDGWRLLPPASL